MRRNRVFSLLFQTKWSTIKAKKQDGFCIPIRRDAPLGKEIDTHAKDHS